MDLPNDFVPRLPFPGFKWKWASLQCTEGLNDPVILLGVLFRLRKLERMSAGVKYNSPEFAEELQSLANDVRGRGIIGVDLARRTGERNLMRNSGQYWSALGLIPSERAGGVIELTDFGRQVADRKISQSEFAALTIQTFTLPNATIQDESECAMWRKAGLSLKPLLLLLEILLSLDAVGQGSISKTELLRLVIPLSGTLGVSGDDIAKAIRRYRAGEIDISKWPDCCERDNDHRIATEYLLFLRNYGYVTEFKTDAGERLFTLNSMLRDEIAQLLVNAKSGSADVLVERLKSNGDVVQEIERKRVQQLRYRPARAIFQRNSAGYECGRDAG